MTAYRDNAFIDIYGELIKLFNLINGTSPAQNRALKVTRYNGGLFNPELHPLLEKWRIGDKDLADILRQLMFSQPPARASDRQRTLRRPEHTEYQETFCLV